MSVFLRNLPIKSMAACTIFEEDEVSIKTDKGFRCGLVIESSEYVSSDDEADDNDDAVGQLKKGLVRVAWHPDGEEEVLPETKVSLLDRSLMPGDVVRRLIQGEESQRGYVTNSSVKCHLQIIGKNRVICGVDSRQLKSLKEWESEPGDIYLDSWVGRVESVQETITLRFPDGAKCTVENDDDNLANCNLWSFEDPLETRESESEFCMNVFYPGQHLTGTLGSLTSANWIKPTKQFSAEAVKKGGYKDVKVVVEDVVPKTITAHWVCRGFGKSDLQPSKIDTPNKVLKEEEIAKLKRLDCFESCSTQIGDKAFYVITDDVTIYNVNPKNNRSLLNYVLPDGKESLGIVQPSEEDLNSKNKAMSGGNDDIISVENSEKPEQANVPTEAGDASCVSTASPTSLVPANDLEMISNVNLPSKELTKSIPCEPNGCTSDEQKTCASDDLETLTSEDPETLTSQEQMSADDWVNVSSDEDDADDEGESCGEEVLTDDINSSTQAKLSSKKKRHDNKHAGGPAVSTRQLKKRKLKRTKRRLGTLDVHPAQPGDQVVVEVLCTYSFADVMWQDGTVEKGIRSTDLYPIHHLDELEFFPGDFVLRANQSESNSSDEYGVVEQVDHVGRTCIVRWMTPPASLCSGQGPTIQIESEEVSVYDIKDHPDYKFRPGQIVVRVAGYEEGDEDSELPAAGQVYELGQNGDLVVAWAGGGTSRCYPQEFYLMGDELSDLNDSEFDSDEETDESSTSEYSTSSWETEKEEQVSNSSGSASASSNCSDSSKEGKNLQVYSKVSDKLSSLMERGCSLVSELESVLESNFSSYVIITYTEILAIHRICKSCDKMMSTSYFKDDALLDVMSAVRSELRSEKTHKVAKQVLNMIKTNSEKAASATQSSDAASETLSPVSSETKLVQVDTTSEPSEKRQPNSPKSKLDSVRNDDGEMLRIQDAKELCNKACSLLKKQIDLVQENVNEKMRKVGTGRRDRKTSKSCSDEAGQGSNQEETAEPPAGDASSPACDASSPTGDASSPTGDASSPMGDASSPSRDASSPAGDIEPHEQLESSPVAAGDNDGSVKPKKTLELSLPESPSKDLLMTPATPQTPADIRAKLEYNKHGFEMLDSVPSSHKFFSSEFKPAEQKSFMTALMKELKLLKSSLPKGIYVKGYEDRMDLFTVMIEGPAHTPYEDGLFFFEVQLANNHPSSPPAVHYISYCSDRLNPNLYECGKVCVSLLGTWTGRGTEVWSNKSTLLQVLISFQGLILVREPYYNEAGYDKQFGTQQALENSRMYNEMAIVKMVQSMTGIARKPPSVFETQASCHLRVHGYRLMHRLNSWLEELPTATGTSTAIEGATAAIATSSCQSNGAVEHGSSETSSTPQQSSTAQLPAKTFSKPSFPLVPLSKGFRLSLQRGLDKFHSALRSICIEESGQI